MKPRVVIFSIFALLLIGTVVLWQVSKSRTFQFFGGLYSSVHTTEKVVALTFDDGPSNKTGEILSTLNSLGVKATFFLSGADLEKNMAGGRQIAAAGHEIGNHTYSHQRMVLKSSQFIAQEIEKTDKLIRDTGYQGEILFRPPNGKKLLFLPYYLKQHGRKTIMWNVEPDSYPEIAANSDQIVNYVLENTKPGSIIILHVMYDNQNIKLNSLSGIVTGLRKQGYNFKTVSELLKYSS